MNDSDRTVFSKKHRAAMSESHKGVPLSESHKAAISEGVKRQRRREAETNEAMSYAKLFAQVRAEAK